MSYSAILFQVEESGIALLTVNRPEKLNALSSMLVGELADAFARVASDPAIRALIITGAGEKAFVAGADIRELAELTPFGTFTHSGNAYTLDLGTLRDAPIGRYREVHERFLPDLFFPPAGLDPVLRRSFVAEAHRRILIPLSAFSFALIPLACLLPGELNRRGNARRVAFAVGAAFLFELADLGVDDLASRFAAAIPLMYVVDLSPFVLGLGVLLHGGIRAGFRWPGLAARGPA